MVYPNTYTTSEAYNSLATKVSTTGNVSLTIIVNVGSGASASKVRAYATHNENTNYLEITTISRDTGRQIFFTNLSYGSLHLGIKTNNFMRLTNLTNEIIFCKPLMNYSNDRLKGNENI